MVCADSSVSDRLAEILDASARACGLLISRVDRRQRADNRTHRCAALVEASDQWRYRILIAERTERIGRRIVERRVGQPRHDPLCH